MVGVDHYKINGTSPGEIIPIPVSLINVLISMINDYTDNIEPKGNYKDVRIPANVKRSSQNPAFT